MALLTFPNPVNEVSARLVAGGVVVMAVATIALDLRWMTVVLAYGFVARVLAGPRLSPLAQLVTRVLTPALRLRARLVPGPPKRFAQGIGAAVTVTAAVLTFGFDRSTSRRWCSAAAHPGDLGASSGCASAVSSSVSDEAGSSRARSASRATTSGSRPGPVAAR